MPRPKLLEILALFVPFLPQSSYRKFHYNLLETYCLPVELARVEDVNDELVVEMVVVVVVDVVVVVVVVVVVTVRGTGETKFTKEKMKLMMISTIVWSGDGRQHFQWRALLSINT